MRQIRSEDIRRELRVILNHVRDGQPLAVVRYKETVAVLVPPGWCGHTLEALGPAEEGGES